MKQNGIPEEDDQEIGLLDDLDEVISAQLNLGPQTTHCLNANMDYNMSNQEGPKPYVKILVQPQSRALRFRYKCEGRYPGALTGIGSTNETKTYPAIRVENYVGKFVVIISCVTKDAPYRPHPHNIVSKEACKDGVYRNKFDRSNMTAQFTSLGIQCVKKTEVKESLMERKKLLIDPFNTQYDHMTRLGDIDLNAVRLCFQVYIEEVPGSEKFRRALDPVVSDVIYDRKAMSDLHITKLSHNLAPIQGGLEMIVLCDKISKDDIEIYFYQEDPSGHYLWEEKADIVSVHKQVAVCFRSPNCSQHFAPDDKLHQAKIHLRRSRVSELGDGREIYLKNVSSIANEGVGGVKRKRSGQEPNIQMQVELMQAQERGLPMVIPVPRFENTLEPRYGVPSPKSDDSPAASPQWMMQSPNAMVIGPQGGQYVQEMGHILPDAGPVQTNQRDIASVNETAEKLDSLDLGIPPQFGSDINLNNLNMDELQMTGPTATPVANINCNGNLETAGSNFSVPNLSASLFESGTSLEQLDLLSSGPLKQFKQEET